MRASSFLIPLTALTLGAALAAGSATAVNATPGHTMVAQRVDALAISSTPPAPCDPAIVPNPGALCGTVTVPQDWADRSGPTFTLAYEVYPHSGPGVATTAMMANPGGPGQATMPFRDFYLSVFAPVLVIDDLVLIDDRGRGQSGAVDCPEVQHGNSDWFGNLGICARRLQTAGTIDHYATGDIAEDTEAVRAALGYDTIDYYGVSSGAVDVEAYALRYPEHLRAIVLDSPWTSQNYTVDTNTMMRDPLLDRVRLVCGGSPACTKTAEHTGEEIGWLAKRLESSLLRGSGLDANGVRHDVVLDEAGFLTRILANDNAAFLNQGEIAAAISAYRDGDNAPLLRLAAENDGTWPQDAGAEPSDFSVGNSFAVMCSEQDWQWDRNASVPERRAQYAAYITKTPKRDIAPFSAAGYFEFAREVYSSGDTCIEWPATHANLPVPAHPVYPDVPTLVLTSNLDLIAPVSTGTVAPRWPNRTFVNVQGIGHATLFWGDCTQGIVQKFLTTLNAGDTSCASHPATAWWALDEFPTTVQRADEHTSKSHDGTESKGARQTVATIAARTLTDGFKRALMSNGDTHVPGLRGGHLTTTMSLEGLRTVELTAFRFASDLAVSGTGTWQGDTVHADLTLDDAAIGHLHIDGTLLGNPTSSTWHVKGDINGVPVDLQVTAS